MEIHITFYCTSGGAWKLLSSSLSKARKIPQKKRHRITIRDRNDIRPIPTGGKIHIMFGKQPLGEIAYADLPALDDMKDYAGAKNSTWVQFNPAGEMFTFQAELQKLPEASVKQDTGPPFLIYRLARLVINLPSDLGQLAPTGCPVSQSSLAPASNDEQHDASPEAPHEAPHEDPPPESKRKKMTDIERVLAI